ncbi:MAG TPA: glycosyltransferase [Desulfobacteraceae bacterium]|nr:glycosyltransferase [Desulfobacteraceae bacterium]
MSEYEQQIQFLDVSGLNDFSCDFKDGVVVIMPCIDRKKGEETAKVLYRRAAIDCRILIAFDSLRQGFIKTLNDTAARVNAGYIVYTAQDAWPGRGWLECALNSLEESGKGLLAFNDGKWRGHIASFGMVRTSWVNKLYGGDILYSGYKAHGADNELTVIARVQGMYLYNPECTLVEIDPDKDGRSSNPEDKALFRMRFAQGFDGLGDVHRLKKLAAEYNVPMVCPIKPDDSRRNAGVSIIIPISNDTHALKRQLEFFFRVNTFQPVEIVIIEHGGAGDTLGVVADYAAEAFIRFINRGRKHTVADSCYFGAARARYPYLLFLKNGEVITSDILPAAVARLKREPSLASLKTSSFEVLRKRKIIESHCVTVTSSEPGDRNQGSAQEILANAEAEWDTRNCPSIVSVEKNIPLAGRLYVVPRTMSPRNTTRYRSFHLREFCRDLIDVRFVDHAKEGPDFFERLRREKPLVLLQRFAAKDRGTRDFLDRLISTQARIVYDMDDQIFDRSEIEDWRIPGIADHPEQYLECMQHADQFLVSTKELRRRLEMVFKKPVHVLHNLLSAEQVSLSRQAAAEKEHAGDEFIIGYASGSATHDRDLAQALDGIARFLADVPEAGFHCIGDVDLPASFMNAHGSRVTIQPKVDWRDLPRILAGFHVQIIPLEDCSFNRYKSQIRFLESAAVGVPVLASAVGEQAQTIIHGYTGCLCPNTEEGWYQGLHWYFDDPGRLRTIGDRASDMALRYWTTGSEFRRHRLKDILRDLTLGVMRDKVSIIVVAYNPLPDIMALCESIKAYTNIPYELLIWVNSPDPRTKEYLNSLVPWRTYLVDLNTNVGKAPAANHLFKIAAERFIAGLDDDFILPESWAENMIRAAKAVPDLGWLSADLTPDSSGIRGRGEVCSYPGGVDIYKPSGVGGWMVFTTASAREKIGFYREHGLYGGIDGDYNRRARRLGLNTGYVRDVVGRHKISRDRFPAWELFKQRIQDEMRIHGKESDKVSDKFTDFFQNGYRPLTCTIKAGFNSGNEQDSEAAALVSHLQRGLESLDYRVRLDCSREFPPEKTRDDVVLHFFSGRLYKPDDYNLNLLWLEAAANGLTRDFLIGFDYILCDAQDTAEMVESLAPEIKTTVLKTKTGQDMTDAIHEAVRFIVKNYVHYKSEGLYRLRNKG